MPLSIAVSGIPQPRIAPWRDARVAVSFRDVIAEVRGNLQRCALQKVPVRRGGESCNLGIDTDLANRAVDLVERALDSFWHSDQDRIVASGYLDAYASTLNDATAALASLRVYGADPAARDAAGAVLERAMAQYAVLAADIEKQQPKAEKQLQNRHVAQSVLMILGIVSYVLLHAVLPPGIGLAVAGTVTLLPGVCTFGYGRYIDVHTSRRHWTQLRDMVVGTGNQIKSVKESVMMQAFSSLEKAVYTSHGAVGELEAAVSALQGSQGETVQGLQSLERKFELLVDNFETLSRLVMRLVSAAPTEPVIDPNKLS